jgi:hypothetical protein
MGNKNLTSPVPSVHPLLFKERGGFEVMTVVENGFD